MHKCDYQPTINRILAEHKRAVHEGVKYSCRIYNYQATTSGSLAGDHRAVQEGVKYCCWQFSQMENLVRHQKNFMKESNTLAGNVTIKQLQAEVLLNTKEQYMKDSNTLV